MKKHISLDHIPFNHLSLMAILMLLTSGCIYHEGDDVYVEEEVVVDTPLSELVFESDTASSDAFLGPTYINTVGDISVISDDVYTSVTYTGMDRFGQEVRVELDVDALLYGEIFEEGLAYQDLEALTFYANVSFMDTFGEGLSLSMDELEIYVDPYDRGRSLLTIQLYGLACACDAYDEIYVEAIIPQNRVEEYYFDN